MYRATCLKNHNKPAAIKVLNVDKMSKDEKQKYMPRELDVFIEAKNEHIIKTIEICKNKHKVFIVMELAPYGDVGKYMESHNGLSHQQALNWFLQATKGLRYLHDTLHTAHRDIKVENILICENHIAKWTDFGLARKAKHGELLDSYCGTKAYGCPQRISHKPYDPFISDVFSMGVLLFNMLHNKLPFHDEHTSRHLKEIKDHPHYIRSHCSSRLSKECVNLIVTMVDPKEANRPTLEKIFTNKWLNQSIKERSAKVKSNKSTKSCK